MKSYKLRMYVNLHWMYVTAETSRTIAVFLKGFAVFLEVSVGLCSNTQLYGLKMEETRALLYLSITECPCRVWHFGVSLLSAAEYY